MWVRWEKRKNRDWNVCKQEPNKHSKSEIEEATVSKQQAKTVSTNPESKALSTFSKVAGFQRAAPFGRVNRREIPYNSKTRKNQP